MPVLIRERSAENLSILSMASAPYDRPNCYRNSGKGKKSLLNYMSYFVTIDR